MDAALHKRLAILIKKERSDFKHWSTETGPQEAGGDEIVSRWASPWLLSGYLQDLLFLAEEFGESAEFYRRRAKNTDRYIRVKGKPQFIAGECGDAYMKARWKKQAVELYSHARLKDEERGGKGLLYAWIAYGFAVLGERELALEFFNKQLNRWLELASRTKAASVAPRVEEIPKAELFFVMRDLAACEASLVIGQEALREVEEQGLSYYKDKLADYKGIAEGITAVLHARREPNNAKELGTQAVGHFESVLCSWLRFNIWDKDCYRFRYDSLVARGLSGPAAQDDAYHRYCNAFGEDLSTTRSA